MYWNTFWKKLFLKWGVSQQKEEWVEESISGCLCASPGSCDLRGAGFRCPVPSVTKEVSCTLFSSAPSHPVTKQLRKSHLGAGGDGIPAGESFPQLPKQAVGLHNIHRAPEQETHSGIFQRITCSDSYRQKMSSGEGGEGKKKKKNMLPLFQSLLYSFDKRPLPSRS